MIFYYYFPSCFWLSCVILCIFLKFCVVCVFGLAVVVSAKLIIKIDEFIVSLFNFDVSLTVYHSIDLFQ